MTRLRVAVDGRPLQSEPLGGVGRYMMGTIPTLADHVDLTALLDARRGGPPASLDPRVEQVRLSAPRGVPGLGWLELAVAPWLRRFGGIFHATFNSAPLTFAGPTVVTVYDLAPQLHPEDFSAAVRVAWRLSVRRSIARAAAIITISEFIRGQIVEYFGVEPRRVAVAPPGVDPLFSPERAGRARELAPKLGLELPYVVAIGGARRRGLPTAIEAWRQANAGSETKSALAVVGEPGMTSSGGLVSIGFPDDERWATLLAGGRALCYPTRYEGFGLPALEAAASGTPVVCAPIASLPEVLGEAGCWATAPSAEAMSGVVARLLSDQGFYDERRAAGLERARSAPSLSDSAQVLLEAYDRTARGR